MKRSDASPSIRIWRDPGGDWKWQAGSVFGAADNEREAREAAERIAGNLTKPRPAGRVRE